MGIGSFLLVYVCLNNRFFALYYNYRKTALFSFKNNFGRGVTIFILFSLLISEIVSCMGVMGVVAQVIQEWSRPITHDGEGFNMIVVAGVICILLYYIFWQGKQALFEKILSLFVLLWEFVFLLPCLL